LKTKFTIDMKKLAAVAVGIAVLIGASASSCDSGGSKAQSKGQKLTEQAYKQQSSTVPYPADQLRDSLERRNLKEKLLRYNDPSKISYLYLLSETGGIYAYYTIKGKVSSNSSQMTTDQLELDHESYGQAVVSAPGDDGSYGPNEPGSFAFTTDGVMVTWNTDYILADAPMKINSANLVLQYQEGSKPTSTAGR
jgi:hypothetical protein